MRDLLELCRGDWPQLRSCLPEHCPFSHFPFATLVQPICKGYTYEKSRHGFGCTITFELDSLSARSWSDVKECPQVLHLQFAPDLPRLPPSAMARTCPLGWNDITSSPPHSRHSRLVILTCDYQNRNEKCEALKMHVIPLVALRASNASQLAREVAELPAY